MSLWSWRRSGWVNLALAILLIVSVITSIFSTGFRSGFKILSPNFSFHGGGSYPEVGLFNILIICSAIFGILSIGLRYSYVMDQLQVMPRSIDYINKVSISMGIISFLGLFIVASFSVSLDDETAMQSLGTYIFVGVGIIFTILQTIVTFSSTKYSLIFTIRFLLAFVLLSTFLTSIIFTEKSKEENSSSLNPSNSTNLTTVLFTSKNQTESSDYYNEKDLLIACILEWISVIIYALYFLSFFKEFQTISAYIIMRPFIGSSANDYRSSSLTVNERV